MLDAVYSGDFWLNFLVILVFRKRGWCTIFASMRFLYIGTWPWWIFRYFLTHLQFSLVKCIYHVANSFEKMNFATTYMCTICWCKDNITKNYCYGVSHCLWHFSIVRRGMKGCFTSFWSIMLRNCFLLFTLQLLEKHARNTEVFLGVLRVYISVWRRSKLFSWHCSFCFFSWLWENTKYLNSSEARSLKYWKTGQKRVFKLLLWLMVSVY